MSAVAVNRQTRTVGPAPLATLPAVAFTDPIKMDLTVYRGDSGRFRVNVVDDTATPVDVTTATWDCDIRATADNPTVIVSLDVEPVAGTPSAVDVILAPADSALLPAAAVWDLQMTLAGEVVTLLAGKVTTTLDVSRT